MRKKDGSVDPKTRKAPLIARVEELEAASTKPAKAPKPRTVEPGKYDGTLCFKGPHGPISMGKDKLQTILAMQNDPLVLDLLGDSLDDRVEGGDA